MLTYTQIIISALVTFLVGVFFATTVFQSFAFAYLLVFVTGALFLVALFARRPFYYFFIGILCLSFSLGIVRFIMWQHMSVSDVLESRIDTRVHAHGIIIEEPDVRENNIHLVVALDEMNIQGATTSITGKALVLVPRYPLYSYGDEVLLNGKLSLPRSFAGDDGRVFNYPEYLHAKGVRYQFIYPHIDTISNGGGNVIMHALFTIKHSFVERLRLVLPEPQSALAEGLLLGGKQSLGNEWVTRFRDVGIVHIIVLSGYNMTIVAEWLAVLFLFLGFYPSIMFAGVGIALFALMAGGGATVVRAALMALLVLLARLTGRTYDVSRALLFAGVIMVLIDPGILVYDPSFQLSFLAALGLLHIAPLLKSHMLRLRQFPVLEEVIVSTIATQILVLPLLVYQTGALSLVSLFANILVLPLIPFAMLFAFLAGLTGFLSIALSFVMMLPAHALLSWMFVVAKYGAKIPFAMVKLPMVSGFVITLVYVIIASYLFFQHKKRMKDVSSELLHQAPSK